MQNLPKKYNIKIPNNTTIIYCNKKKIITIIGPLKKKSLKLKIKILISKTKKNIQITPTTFSEMSNHKKKKIKTIQGTTTSLLKQMLIETSTTIYQKLKFIGIGYRSFQVDNFKNKVLLFKLGYSHQIYFKIKNELNIFCLKLTKLFIYGNSYQNITQTSSLIRSCKKPEPYKGKGILYENENIKLKEGKKI